MVLKEEPIKPLPESTPPQPTEPDRWQMPVLPECEGVSENGQRIIWHLSVESEVVTAWSDDREPEYGRALDAFRYICQHYPFLEWAKWRPS